MYVNFPMCLHHVWFFGSVAVDCLSLGQNKTRMTMMKSITLLCVNDIETSNNDKLVMSMYLVELRYCWNLSVLLLKE